MYGVGTVKFENKAKTRWRLKKFVTKSMTSRWKHVWFFSALLTQSSPINRRQEVCNCIVI